MGGWSNERGKLGHLISSSPLLPWFRATIKVFHRNRSVGGCAAPENSKPAVKHLVYGHVLVSWSSALVLLIAIIPSPNRPPFPLGVSSFARAMVLSCSDMWWAWSQGAHRHLISTNSEAIWNAYRLQTSPSCWNNTRSLTDLSVQYVRSEWSYHPLWHEVNMPELGYFIALEQKENFRAFFVLES